MDTKKFLENYRAIESLIENNWKKFCRAYKNLCDYGFNQFTVDPWDCVSIESQDSFRGETDYGYANVPLAWFESEELLISNLDKKIKEREENELKKKKEDEERSIRMMEKEKEALQRKIDEYYKNRK